MLRHRKGRALQGFNLLLQLFLARLQSLQVRFERQNGRSPVPGDLSQFRKDRIDLFGCFRQTRREFRKALAVWLLGFLADSEQMANELLDEFT